MGQKSRTCSICTSMVKRDLGERVAEAAVQALKHEKYVSAVNVLMNMGLLQPYQFEKWRQGQVPDLESGIQCGPRKLNDILLLFRSWVQARGLQPNPIVLKTHHRGTESCPLRFSISGDPDLEREYRTQWLSTELPA